MRLMKSVQIMTQFAWKQKQIEDNFTREIIGYKVDQIFGNETVLESISCASEMPEI